MYWVEEEVPGFTCFVVPTAQGFKGYRTRVSISFRHVQFDNRTTHLTPRYVLIRSPQAPPSPRRGKRMARVGCTRGDRPHTTTPLRHWQTRPQARQATSCPVWTSSRLCALRREPRGYRSPSRRGYWSFTGQEHNAARNPKLPHHEEANEFLGARPTLELAVSQQEQAPLDKPLSRLEYSKMVNHRKKQAILESP